MRITIIICTIFLSQLALSQEKFEIEKRIQPDQAPKTAAQYVAQFDLMKKVKWYAEISQDGTRVEAKTKINGRKYSIEFDTNGGLIDVEVETAFSEVTKSVQDEIHANLGRSFLKYKIQRVQVQFSGDPNLVQQASSKLDTETTEPLAIQYEIIIKAKKSELYELYEVTTDRNGSIQSQLVLIVPKSENLEF